jgi:phosphatidylglycerophosphate synthase
MRTALLVLPTGPDRDAPHPGSGPVAVLDLVAQLRALGRERVVVLGPPELLAPVRAAGVEVLEARGPVEQLEAVGSCARAASSVDLLAADLVIHGGALEQVLSAPGDGVTALVAATPLGGEEARLEVVDGAIRDVAPRSAVTASDAPRFAQALHVGRSGLGRLSEAVDALMPLWSHTAVDQLAGPPRDVHEQVLVALVRSGTRVAAVPVGGFVAARASTSEEVALAVGARSRVDEEAVRLARAVKGRDGFFTTYLVSPYSRYIARWCARRGITPNQVSVASLIVGVAAAACFAVGTFAWMVAGAVLLQAAFTLDCVDGQLARYSRTFSPFGAWLDAVFDRAKEFAVYAGLAAGAVRTTGDPTVWWLAGAALAFQTFRHHLDFAFAVHREMSAPAREPQPLRPSDLVAGSPDTAPAPRSTTADPVADRSGLLRAARSFDAIPAARWFKAIVILPIGERFALISLGAIVLGARGTFVALLGWGVVAAGYLATGRLLRTVRA